MTPSLSDILRWQDADSAPAADAGPAEGLLAMGTGAVAKGAGATLGIGARLMGGDTITANRIADGFAAAHTYQPRTAAGHAAIRGLLKTSKHFNDAADDFGADVLGVQPSAVTANVKKFSPDLYSDLAMGTQAAGLAAPALSGVSKLGGLLGDMADERALSAPLAGAPEAVVPHAPARQAASDYLADAGMEPNPPTDFEPANPERGKQIADAYAAMRHAPDDPEVKAAYDAMIKETLAQYQHIKKTGLKVDFIPQGAPDPYAAGPRAAIDDVRENNHLHVFPTDSGFGSDASFDAMDNPLMQMTDEVDASGNPMRANDVFRVVHDYFGHVQHGNGFRAAGEEAAWRSHAGMYSPLARRAMTSETRGQNSWVNYGPHGEKNRTASTPDTVFADQKTGLLPEEFSDLPDDRPLGERIDGGNQLGRIGGRWNAGGKQTVQDPQRNAFPGIYSDPRALVASAEVAPEDPMLHRLFGVTRQDMYDETMGRKGNEAGVIPGAAKNPSGSDAATKVMGAENTRRVSDLLGEAMNRKDLAQGMVPWYYMDPAFKRMETLMGRDEAVRQYRQLNTLTGMSSPGSDVHTELNRGTAAHMLANQGRFSDFQKFAGMDEEDRAAAGAPADLMGVLAHPYHPTAHTKPMAAYLSTGTSQMKSPKVPAYIQASGVPETGFQTDLPVADAHYSRGLGLADTRNPRIVKGKVAVPASSISKPELQAIQPWWQKLAAQHGLESVPAQALQWGGMSTATGVKTAVGAPKLEIMAGAMARLAQKMGITPEEARDLVLQGKAYVPGTHTQAQIRAMLADQE